MKKYVKISLIFGVVIISVGVYFSSRILDVSLDLFRSRAATMSSFPSVVSFGPMPFVRVNNSDGTFNRFEIRQDYSMLYESPSSWLEIQGYSQDVELYYMMFQYPRGTFNFDQFVKTLREKGKTVSLQTGYLSIPPGLECPAGTGRLSADAEKINIDLWLQADSGRGKIDKIILDNPYWKILTHMNSGRCPGWSDQKKVDYIITEVSEYFKRMRELFPQTTFGLTDGIAAFRLNAPDGFQYDPTVATIPRTDFRDYIQRLKDKSGVLGVTISEFAIDFWDAVENEPSKNPTYTIDGADYGRILGVEKVLRDLSIPVGVYINAFPEASFSAPVTNPVAARQAVKERMRKFLNGYRSLSGNADIYRFAFWHDIPDITGPESVEGTALNIIRDTMRTITPITKPGDIDRDGDVDIFDYNRFVQKFGQSGTFPEDLDGNGRVDIFDYNILVTNFGR